MIKHVVLLSFFIMPTLAHGMPNPWMEGTRNEIMAEAGFNPPMTASIERCGKSSVWRFLKSDDVVEAICPKGGHAETKVRVSRKPLGGDYVVYTASSHEIYKSVGVSLKRRNTSGNYVRAEFHVKEYYYTLDINPGTDHEAMMFQVRSIIDKLNSF